MTVGMGHWVTAAAWGRMRRLGMRVSVVDSLGGRVDRVVAYRKHSNGIEVKLLGTVNAGSLAVVGGKEAVEFRGFIPGGDIRVERTEPELVIDFEDFLVAARGERKKCRSSGARPAPGTLLIR